MDSFEYKGQKYNILDLLSKPEETFSERKKMALIFPEKEREI